jgi:isopenicillin N synthase-like dioxygenase
VTQLHPAVDDASTDAFTTIPEVDLSRWRRGPEERAALADEVRRICHEVGFFQLVGHGVPAEFRRRYFGLLEAFFALPDDVKARIDKRRSPHFRGWERVGAELTDNRTDYREQLDVSTEHEPYPPDADPPYLRLDGPNQWLPEDVLPGFHAAVDELFTRLGAVADELMEVLSVGLGLRPDHLHEVFGERPLSLAKLISYPPTPPGEAGVNAHHDAGFLTLLMQHHVGGLQVLNPDDQWIDVPPRDDAFVVNLGEMLQEMTGNYMVATTHRVIATEARFSSGYFHGPDLRTRLDPLPLAPEYAAAVAASTRHASAGFMAKRDELVAGEHGTRSSAAGVYGQQLWNYYARSYPENVAAHYG